MKPAMQDAELEVAWVVLRGRNASTELPARVRSSDMVPGCWKPVRRRLVVDLHARELPRTCWLVLADFASSVVLVPKCALEIAANWPELLKQQHPIATNRYI